MLRAGRWGHGERLREKLSKGEKVSLGVRMCSMVTVVDSTVVYVRFDESEPTVPSETHRKGNCGSDSYVHYPEHVGNPQ